MMQCERFNIFVSKKKNQWVKLTIYPVSKTFKT